jgi:uroporphyrinogen-III synthase
VRVVLTRPAQEAGRWADALRARGHEVLELPLIEIAPAPDAKAARQAWEGLDRYDAAMFVSASAVQHFRALAPAVSWPAETRAWSTGPGTAHALAAAGVPAGQIDTPPPDAAQFDSEALWARVASQVRPASRVLVVRGAGPDGQVAGRDWLAQRLAEAGASVDTVVAYQRRRPDWSDVQRAQATAAADGAVWLLSSSEAVGHLAALLPGVAWARARAIATHERIAQAARDAGFGVVVASRPAVDAVVAALESIR